jgi:predicted nuclease of restriction endonuclease-like (RecB) superfamily
LSLSVINAGSLIKSGFEDYNAIRITTKLWLHPRIISMIHENLPVDYGDFLDRIKSEIRLARFKVNLAANSALLQIYWQIGCWILNQQNRSEWGAKVIDKLSQDLRKEFPDMQGLSARNLKYMRQFAAIYPDPEFVQATLAQIPWYHHITLLNKVKSHEERLFYVKEAYKNGWSRDVMVAQIDSRYFKRKGKAISNFSSALPSPQSDLVQQITKDPYIFDFLNLTDLCQEKELEDALTDHVMKFLLELGAGFAFVGKQVHIEVGDQDFYIDLLFYHVKLHCYVVVELKKGKFMPEYAGKLNFYLSVVDDKLRSEGDQPSIGLLICQDKNEVIAEYALRDLTKPIGISQYELIEAIPKSLKASLPSIKVIKQEIGQSKSSSRKRPK